VTWPFEFCHRQRQGSSVLSSLLFLYLEENRSDLMKDYIAGDLE